MISEFFAPVLEYLGIGLIPFLLILLIIIFVIKD